MPWRVGHGGPRRSFASSKAARQQGLTAPGLGPAFPRGQHSPSKDQNTNKHTQTSKKQANKRSGTCTLTKRSNGLHLSSEEGEQISACMFTNRAKTQESRKTSICNVLRSDEYKDCIMLKLWSSPSHFIFTFNFSVLLYSFVSRSPSIFFFSPP